MVHERDSQQSDADRLDALWDDLIRSDDAPHISDVSEAPFIAYLDALAPGPDSAARARIRRRVFGARQENMMEQPVSLHHTNGHQPSLAASRPLRLSQPRRRFWFRLPMAAMEVTTAFAVLAAIVVGVWMMRPHGGPSLPAVSNVGSPASTPRASGHGGTIATLELDNTASNTALSVTVQRVTLPPNAGWVFPDGAFPRVPVPVSQFVESGTLTVGVRGQNVQVTAGNNSKVEGGPQYLLNSSSEPVTFLQLLAYVTGKTAPEPPSTATVTTIADVPLPSSPADMHTLITLNQATFTGAGASVIPIVPNQQTIFLRVETGELRIYTVGDADGQLLKTGESVTVTDGGITDTEIHGDTTATALFLNLQTQTNAERVANDPRAGSTVDWQIPDGGGNVGFLLNELTLAPAAEMSFDLDGAVHARVATGMVKLTSDAGDTVLGVDGHAGFAGQGHLVIRNLSTQDAVVLLGVVYGEWTDAPGITHENRTGDITATVLGTAVAHLPVGPATVSLAPIQVPAEVGASASNYLHEAASLLAGTHGTITLTKMAGDIVVWHDVASNPAPSVEGGDMLELGKPISFGAGDAAFIYPNAGYRVEPAPGAADATPQLFALTVTSLAKEPAATPTAANATPEPAQAFTVPAGTPCDVAPRTLEDLQAILNPESATGTPSIGLRDHQATGAPADPETVAGIRQTVTDLAACQSNGSGWQTYALYSANAIRLMADANNLTAEELAAEADSTPAPNITGASMDRQRGMTIAIGDVLSFPDGRVGAMVNFDGELAYLTFVHQGDRWLIDAWDDR
ncbi:MAG TPA: hypothetical protein VFL82_00415 [Thermomicrobiales bacterium]|nr:hypothetical protein [Thermomicrobiales bacterium]